VNPVITNSITLSPAQPSLGENTLANFTVQNLSNNPITIPVIGVAVRDPNGANVGYPGDTNVTIPAGGSYTYSKTRTFTGVPGTYRFFVTSFVNNAWNDNYPVAYSGVLRQNSIEIRQ
jgi:hypothetical protein